MDRGDGAHGCALTQTNCGDVIYDKSLATAWDKERYFAILETSPDFGCGQFEARDGSD
jgi:hypothetical protein